MPFIQLINEQESFTYTHPGLDGSIEFRRLHPEVSDRILRTYRKVEHRHGTRQVFVPEERSIDLEKDYWDYIILSWSGVQDQGKSVACTRDTKFLLPRPIKDNILALADEANLSGLRTSKADEDGHDHPPTSA